MSPAEKLKGLLFLALFFGALGFLFTLLSCGTEYWLLAVQSCSRSGEGNEAWGDTSVFHEGLFWRCDIAAVSRDYSLWDLWISSQPPSEVCRVAFLFPFPVSEPQWPMSEQHSLPTEPYKHHFAIVLRTFWSMFLVVGVTFVVIGGFVAICAAPLTNHKLCRVGGALYLCGGLCLLAVVVMYLTWVQVLDTLEQFALHQKALRCPSFHLSVQHGPSFLLAPVAVFFCLLAGLLSILTGRRLRDTELEKNRNKSPELSAPDAELRRSLSHST